MDESFQRTAELASAQHGVFAWRQVSSFVTRGRKQSWVQRGLIQRQGFGVYRLAGTTTTWRQRAMAGALAYGPPCAVSGRAAARLWELDGVAPPAIELTVPLHRNGGIEGIATKRRRLDADDVVERFAIPVTSPLRTLIDLACDSELHAVLPTAVDDAIRRRLCSPSALADRLASEKAAGRLVPRAIWLIVEQRIQAGVGDSVWEDRVALWIVDAHLPPPKRNFTVIINGVPRRLDFAYPEYKIALEFQGEAYHGPGTRRFHTDAERLAELQLAGWLVIPVTAQSDPAAVIERLRRAIEQRRLRHGA